MTHTAPLNWLRALPLLLVLSCCTQPAEEPEEPEDAGAMEDSAQDAMQDTRVDATFDADSDLEPEADVPPDPELPESELYCDPDYAHEQLDKGIVPEQQSLCSCNGRTYNYVTGGPGGYCFTNYLHCQPTGWSTSNFCIQDTDDPMEDTTADTTTDAPPPVDADVPPDSE